MEDTVKEHSSAGGVSANSAGPKLQRYTLRSAVKSNKEKSDASDLSNSVTSKRGRPISSVSKSMGIVDLCGKETCLRAKPKPPRRLSIAGPKQSGNNITPISERRRRRSGYGEVKRETPTSEISRSSSRKKFNTLSSASFWLCQIKASEYAAKHSISLGFFKLALQAGCEPHHHRRLQEELKSYVHRYQLAELGETVKLFESYNISEKTEQLQQVSECVSQIPEEETSRVCDDDVQSSCTTSAGNLKPECLNTDSSKVSPERKPSKKETREKRNPGSRVRGSLSKSSGNGRSGFDSGSRGSVRRPEKPRKEESNNREKGKIRKQGKKSHVKQGPISPSLAGDKQGNKENMDGRPSEEISLKQEV